MTTQQFIFEEPLYKRVSLSENPRLLNELMNYISIDGYNVCKGVDSTFTLKQPLHHDFHFEPNISTEQIVFVCQRYGDKFFVQIHYDVGADYIEKVGQYPSIADIHIAQVKQYSKVLDKQYMKDFTKAIGLAANGVGTGSFVYLRRVFEHLVDEIAKKAIADGEIHAEEYNPLKMDKKLKMLEHQLPDVLKDNKPLYGVLRKGIHELSEEDCLQFFSVVRQITELILDDFEFTRQKAEKKRLAHNSLAQIAGKIK